MNQKKILAFFLCLVSGAHGEPQKHVCTPRSTSCLQPYKPTQEGELRLDRIREIHDLYGPALNLNLDQLTRDLKQRYTADQLMQFLNNEKALPVFKGSNEKALPDSKRRNVRDLNTMQEAVIRTEASYCLARLILASYKSVDEAQTAINALAKQPIHRVRAMLTECAPLNKASDIAGVNALLQKTKKQGDELRKAAGNAYLGRGKSYQDVVQFATRLTPTLFARNILYSLEVGDSMDDDEKMEKLDKEDLSSIRKWGAHHVYTYLIDSRSSKIDRQGKWARLIMAKQLRNAGGMMRFENKTKQDLDYWIKKAYTDTMHRCKLIDWLKDNDLYTRIDLDEDVEKACMPKNIKSQYDT